MLDNHIFQLVDLKYSKKTNLWNVFNFPEKKRISYINKKRKEKKKNKVKEEQNIKYLEAMLY